jgi:AcrR family transcriptional regulator
MRPKDADSRKTIDAILAAVAGEVGDGVEPRQISMRRVASRAGVSLGTIQYYFGSRDELLESALDAYYERLAGLITSLHGDFASVAPEGALSAKAIDGAARRLYRFVLDERPFTALRLATNAERGELHPRRQGDFQAAIIGAAVEALTPHCAVTAEDLRMSLLAMSAMIVRFGVMSESELVLLTGQDGAAARTHVEGFVGRTACRLLGLPPR